MQDRTGEECPSCKKGKLKPTGNREVNEPNKKPRSGLARREFTEYECDVCGHKCKGFGIEVNETLNLTDKAYGKIRKKRI